MSQLASSLHSRLAELTRPDRVIVDTGSLASYRVDGRIPAAALLPESAEEISEILRFASVERLAVIPIGGRNHLGIGMPPRQYDLALDLSRMNRILAYEPQDLTLGIEPGTRCSELSRALQRQGQFLPIASPVANGATMGGTVAAGIDTPWRYSCGTARDLLLGIEFVTGEGTVSKSGGRVVKNVTGYDLHKIFIGCIGTLGVITRLNFRTFPLPPARKMFVIKCSNSYVALEICRTISKSPLQPRILEVLDPGAAQMLGSNGIDFADHHSWLVIVEAVGHDAVIKRYDNDLGTIAQKQRGTDFLRLEESEAAELFVRLCDFSRIALDQAPSAVIFRIAATPSVMPMLSEKLRALAQDTDLHCALLVRALSVVYFALIPPQGRVSLPSLINCSRSIMDFCAKSEMPPMIERCPLDVKLAVGIWPPAGREHRLAQDLKHIFDPHMVLSPARFQGGI
jgi:glycolate oxidase FAD binding subunit